MSTDPGVSPGGLCVRGPGSDRGARERPKASGAPSPRPIGPAPEPAVAVDLEQALALELEELRLAREAEARELRKLSRRDQAGTKVMISGGVIIGLSAVAGITLAAIALDLGLSRLDPVLDDYDTTPLDDAYYGTLTALAISSVAALGGATLLIAGGVARANARRERATTWVAPVWTGARVGLAVGGRF